MCSVSEENPLAGLPQALDEPPQHGSGLLPFPRPAVRPSLFLPSLLGLHEEVEVGPGELLVDAVQ